MYEKFRRKKGTQLILTSRDISGIKKLTVSMKSMIATSVNSIYQKSSFVFAMKNDKILRYKLRQDLKLCGHFIKIFPHIAHETRQKIEEKIADNKIRL